MHIEELKAAALQLNPEARADLARELLASLEAMNEMELETLWIDEAIQRDEGLDTRTHGACPVDEALSRARSRRK